MLTAHLQRRLSAPTSRSRTPRMDNWDNFPDPRLTAATLKGSQDAFGELVRRHQTTVFNIAYRLTGDRQEALDLSQEAFVHAYRALAGYEPSRPFAPWLYRIVTNLALNWLQRRHAPELPLAAGAEGDELPAYDFPDVTAEPERVFLSGEQQARVRRAILALPPRFRAVIELRHFQELSYDEIAAALDMPLSDVKSKLFRARHRLRVWLETNP